MNKEYFLGKTTHISIGLMDKIYTHSQPGIVSTQNNPDYPDSSSAAQQDPDEINMLEYFYIVVKNKWLLAGATVLGLVVGYITAIIIGPTWVSQTVIVAKESDNSKIPSLSGLGMLGGVVASQLNIAGDPGLDKIDLILGSKKFNAEVIEKYNLLPLVYKNSWPADYRKFYDSTKALWSEDFIQPNLLRIGNYLKETYLKRTINKNGTMTISFESRDSLFSDTLLSLYLSYLNHYIQTNVQYEASENVRYLENQLISISDPLLREKLLAIIASELEKSMIVSKEAFKIIDPIFTEGQVKFKKLLPLVFAIILDMFLLIFFIVSYVFGKSRSSKYESGLVEAICKEITRIPFTKKVT